MDILVLPGDGIGPEITDATLHVVRQIDMIYDLGLRLDVRDVGLKALREVGTTLANDVWDRANEADGIILAPLSTYEYPPRDRGGLNPSAEFRHRLKLFANYRPCKQTLPYCGSSKAIDMVVVRENTEGFYASRSMYEGSGEFMPDPKTAFALRKITEEASRAIASAAFELARTRRRHVTVVHKANVLKVSDGLFLRTVQDVARDHPDVSWDEMLVDAAAALLIRNPERFDVLLTTNMFGDILSNEAAEMAGGLGLAPSLNAGCSVAMAQAAHGSAPDIAGRNIANPTGLMLSAAMLLHWLGQRHGRSDLQKAAMQLEGSVLRTLKRKETRTQDLGGPLDTSQFAGSFVKNLVAGEDECEESVYCLSLN